MCGDVAQRQRAAQAGEQLVECPVLRFLEGAVVRAFELDADGEVVARGASAPGGRAGMPSAPVHRDELDEAPVAPDEKVSGYFHPLDLAEIRMRPGVETVGEEFLDAVAAVLAGGQTD